MFAHDLIRAGYENETPDALALEAEESARRTILVANAATCRRSESYGRKVVREAMAPALAAREARNEEARAALAAIYGETPRATGDTTLAYRTA